MIHLIHPLSVHRLISSNNSGKEIRVWGWITEASDAYNGPWDRDKKVANTIYRSIEHLSKNYDLEFWREINSPRSPRTPSNGDAQAFLRNLLGL
ncbi:MAG: hypothetical protein JRH06_10140 [Deltaproteobacteria bacterium]|nr:hypothetical protein [Deltaproteobacteria bacterium]